MWTEPTSTWSSGTICSSTREQSFSLSLVNLDPGTVIDPDGDLWDLTGIAPTLKGRTDLVTDTGFTVSADGLHLIFNGKINLTP